MSTMTLSEELTWRGFINQTTYSDLTALDDSPMTFYWGVDPSASSMTVGNFAAAMLVRHFIDHGHKAILLIGGATGLIGDPDGKKQERDLKTLEEIDKNIAGISAQYQMIFAGKPFKIVNNYDWFKSIGYMDFLRDIGKHVSLTQMLDRDFIQSRIGEGGAGISYAEFSYALIQGYDFLHLYRTEGTTVQLAGADQWGNSITGVSLIRKLEGVESHVLTLPIIINKTTGVKFGKSEEGAIWLDETQTSVYKFYQFWLNTDDVGVIDYMKIYTLLSREEIDRYAQLAIENPGAREAQKALAYEVTKLVHGEERANTARTVTEVLFGNRPITEMTDEDISMLAQEIPVSTSGRLLEILIESGAATSSNEAKRLLAGGALRINGAKVADDQVISAPSLIKKGKNSFILVR